MAGPDHLVMCRAACDRAEQDFPYGAVDQLLRRLPPGTTGLGELVHALTPTASPFAVGADLLDVLAAVADTAPLAVLVDDVPWADDHSLKALAFVLRRCYAERLLVVLTARTPGTVGSDVP
ncbi:hypothetical protein [Streptomyces sp. NPDC126514]|uniref:hypothetical protein n=1 Tax=Streptomyces sp. NPDC126514 TaxID=3155210 RepID=UPI003329DE6A